MGITHGEFLKRLLESKKMELTELKVRQRIALAEFDVKFSMLADQISTLEKQLEDGK